MVSMVAESPDEESFCVGRLCGLKMGVLATQARSYTGYRRAGSL